MKAIVVALSLLCITAGSSIAVACPACDEKEKSAASEIREIRTLTPAQVHAQIATGRIRVFDANPADIFDKHHVMGAIRVEYDQVELSDLPKDKSAPIVFYCMNELCGASPIAASRAVSLGYTDVSLMPAGIQGWIEAKLPVESRASAQTLQ